MKKVTIYTDGACSGNPGPGGWGAVLLYGAHRKELSGGDAETTNNRMELMAAISALEALREACEVELYTDSAYVSRAFSEDWIARWKRNGFQTSAKKPVENRDLWERLIRLNEVHRVHWNKVKGHSDNALNNRCDALARAAVPSMKAVEKPIGQ